MKTVGLSVLNKGMFTVKQGANSQQASCPGPPPPTHLLLSAPKTLSKPSSLSRFCCLKQQIHIDSRIEFLILLVALVVLIGLLAHGQEEDEDQRRNKGEEKSDLEYGYEL